MYRLLESGVIGGVCSGLALFWDIDVTLVRIGVVVLTLLELALLHSPFMLLAYLAALFIVPAADTSEERAAARGIPFNAQQLIDEAKRNFSHIGDRDWKATRRQWRQQRRWERKFERQMRHSYQWAGAGPSSYGEQVALGVTTPVATLFSVAAFWALAYAALSLANTGAILGWPLPAGVPLWVGLIGLLCIYSSLVWPLRLWRRASFYRLAGPDHARYHAVDGLMSVVAGLAIFWAAYHYRPEVREWIQHLPEAWNNVVVSFRGSGIGA
ncbi:MAG: PspC domain-containing protein [Vicinamibacterales bacterium]